ncbi:MAG: putative toxin-antitoxin system toxin component, PIN family, partial [Ramlibacter sp.]
VFNDEAAGPLREALESGASRWLATPAMREEFERVLAYPKIARRLTDRGLTREGVLAAFDRRACTVEVPAKALFTCADPDDQKFIDLAAAHRALLLSKDHDVLAMAKRMASLHVTVHTALKL